MIEAPRRSVYGLVFLAVAYVGALAMLGLGWPPFVENVFLPRLARARAQVPEDASPPPPPHASDPGELVEELPPATRALYRAGRALREPLVLAFLALPIAAAAGFEALVRGYRAKMAVYYAGSAVVGLAILVSACLLILEVWDFGSRIPRP